MYCLPANHWVVLNDKGWNRRMEVINSKVILFLCMFVTFSRLSRWNDLNKFRYRNRLDLEGEHRLLFIAITCIHKSLSLTYVRICGNKISIHYRIYFEPTSHWRYYDVITSFPFTVIGQNKHYKWWVCKSPKKSLSTRFRGWSNTTTNVSFSHLTNLDVTKVAQR